MPRTERNTRRKSPPKFLNNRMAVDLLFTNGVIAAREKFLLKDKIVRMCEMSPDDAFRALTESGFGGGEGATVYDYEALVAADERSIDDFIREYAPSRAELCYLLSPRDFHNAKAFVKAEALGTDVEKLLAPEGLVTEATFRSCFQSGDFSALPAELRDAIQSARVYLAEGGDSGAEIGAVFERALLLYLSGACRRNGLLKKLIAARADMTNILTALRAVDRTQAESYYVEGGKLTFSQLSEVSDGEESALHAMQKTPYEAFVRLCYAAKSQGLPMTEAERLRDSYEIDTLAENRYELKASQPFLYYVFRRRAENENVRIVFVCLLGKMPEREIKKRLRGI